MSRVSESEEWVSFFTPWGVFFDTVKNLHKILSFTQTRRQPFVFRCAQGELLKIP
jgi:hypothetical protein